MKKIILLLIIPVLVFCNGCGNSKKEGTSSAIPGMKEVQIKINGNALLVMVPSDSTKGRLEIVEPTGKTFNGGLETISGQLAENDRNRTVKRKSLPNPI